MTLRRKIQSYGMITLITVLIWLYAEGQDVRSREIGVTGAVPLALADQDTMIDVEESNANRISLTLTAKGNTARLQTLSTYLGEMGILDLAVTVDNLPEGSEGRLALRPLIERAVLGPGGTTLADMGIILDRVQPATVNVQISRLEFIEADVLFQPQGIEIKPDRKIDPPRVGMMVPREVLDRLRLAQDAFFVEADVPKEQLDQLPEGQPHTITARLQLPPVLRPPQASHVRLMQPTVDVTFTIAGKRQSIDLASPVPVWVMAPSSELKLYDVVLDDQFRVLRDVRVTAPRELIEKLSDPNRGLRVVAKLSLDRDAIDTAINAGGKGAAEIDLIEIHEPANGEMQVLAAVPLNRDPASVENPATSFLSPAISITTAVPIGEVGFTISRRSE